MFGEKSIAFATFLVALLAVMIFNRTVFKKSIMYPIHNALILSIGFVVAANYLVANWAVIDHWLSTTVICLMPLILSSIYLKRVVARKIAQVSDQISFREMTLWHDHVENCSDKNDSWTEYAVSLSQGVIVDPYSMPDTSDSELGRALVSIGENLQSIVDSTAHILDDDTGEIDVTVATSHSEGIWKEISESMNAVIVRITNPILTINKVVNALAAGDLTIRYNDEAQGKVKRMASNLNLALDNIDGLLHQVSSNARIIDESSRDMKASSDEMSTNTDEIASAIAQMSHGAQNQQLKIDQVSELLETILGTSNEMGKKAESIYDAAKTGAENSEDGMKMVNNVVSSMNQIAEYAGRTNHSITVLKERSREISRVLGVITDIASQTNLLALNAAIEAAQAGDAGRGFAVVAEEIRKLAEDSKKSAREIESLINGVRVDTDEAAKVINEMNQSVKTGEDISRRASESFKEILISADKTLNFSEEILNATKSQVLDINNVVIISESIVVIAEQTAAGAEEVASSASELSSGMNNFNIRIQKLAEVAESFKEGISMVKISGDANKNTAIFQMKEAFEKEKAFLDALMETLPDRIYFKDKNSVFTRVSRSMLKLYKVDNYDALVGKSTFDMLSKEYADKLYADECRIMDTKNGLINDIVEEKRDGKSIWVSTTKLPLLDADGNSIGTFGVTKDITDLKENEFKIIEQLKSLQLQTEQMKSKEQKLKEVDELLQSLESENRQLKQRISHES